MNTEMDYLPSKFFDVEDISDKIKKVEIPHIEGIIVDENHKISEDTKFGYELSKDSAAWYRYFGL
jgi:hypothetical protein